MPVRRTKLHLTYPRCARVPSSPPAARAERTFEALARISQRYAVHRRSASAKSVVQQQFFGTRGRTPMPTECISDVLAFAPVDGRRVEASFYGGALPTPSSRLLMS